MTHETTHHIPDWQCLGLPRPFETGTEESLARELKKHLDERTVLKNRIDLRTPHGCFLIDFTLSLDDRAVGLEMISGGHECRRLRDLRHAAIIRSGAVGTIYWVPAQAVDHHLPEVLCLLSRLEPAFFTWRGRISTEKASRLNIKGSGITPITQGLAFYFVPDEHDTTSTSGWIPIQRTSPQSDRFTEAAAFLEKHPQVRVGSICSRELRRRGALRR